MGHFIYEKYASYDVEKTIDASLEEMLTETGELDDDIVAICEETVTNWVQEIFCDLFAICLIGPAFSFALSQLSSASMIIDRPDGEPDSFYRFEQEHPADVARFHYHKLLLEKLKWWEAIQNSQCAPVQVLKACAGSSKLFTIEIDGRLPSKVTDARLLRCFNRVCTWLIRYVPSIVKRRGDDVRSFKEQYPTIVKYLERAVIPSSIMMKGKRMHPTPAVLVNAGYMFFLEKLPQLLSNIDLNKKKSDSIESRGHVSGRLELWLLKALEDHRLITMEPKS